MLEIKEVTPQQFGEYSCTAKNVAGSKRENAQLVVKEGGGSAPTFAKNLEDRLILEHETLIMEAQLSTGIQPPPTIQWLRDGKPLQSNDHWKITEEASRVQRLYVTRVEMEDKGRITCEAENKFGKAECSASLGVQKRQSQSKPKFMSELGPYTINEGDSLKARVLISGDPAPYAKWYINNQMVYKTEDTEMTNEGGNLTYILIMNEWFIII
jgi:hypothetical protein